MADKMFFSKSDKMLIEVKGAEVAPFLNDLLTAECVHLNIGEMRQACLLNPQGRIIHDMLIFRREEESFWLETQTEQAPQLMQKLKMYRLRRPIEIAALEGWQALIGLSNDTASDRPDMDQTPDWAVRDGRYIRAEADFAIWHMFFKDETDMGNAELHSPAAYHWLRLGIGLPEGTAELSEARALVVEAGFHLGDAVDFKKGCYVGQEVTARTHYRGSVKKYLIAVEGMMNADQGDPQTPLKLSQDDKEIGQILHICKADKPGQPSRAMAMIRKEAALAYLNVNKKIELDGQAVGLMILPALKTALEGESTTQS